MDLAAVINSYEQLIGSIANRFYFLPPMIDKEDLLQAGRLVILELAEQKPERTTNRAYIGGAIYNAMLNEISKVKPGDLRNVSLNEPVYRDDETTLADVVASSESSLEAIITEDRKPVVFDIGAGYQLSYEKETARVYYEVLTGQRERFPRGFFSEDRRRRGRVLTKLLFTKIIGMKPEDIAKIGPRRELIKSYKLDSVVQVCYGSNMFVLFQDLCPDSEPFEIRHRGMWQDPQQRRRAIRHLFEKNSVPEEEIPKYATQEFFADNRLRGLLKGYYKDSPCLAIEDAFPNSFKPWELKSAPHGYWKGGDGLEHAKEAMSWLANKLQIPVSNLRKKMFLDNHLEGMLAVCFGGSLKRAKEYVLSHT